MKKLWHKYSFAIILIVLSCSFTFAFSMTNQTKEKDKYITVTVSDGDSLWKISKQFSGRHTLSNEQFVSWVKAHNQINEDRIYPGEEIIIPVSKQAPSNSEFASAAK